MKKAKKDIAVLIPCYNESETIGRVINDFQKHLPGACIYVFDNNSSDGTASIARKHGAIVFHENRQGKGNVVRTMFRSIKADCYLMVDGDSTYSAKDAKRLCSPILNNDADMVIGDRLSSTYFEENKRLFHGIGNKLVRKLINRLFRSNVEDVMTGYRALSYDLVKSFPVLSRGFEIETELTIFAVDKNFRIQEIPISYIDRPENSTSKLNTYSDGLKVLRTITVLFKEYKPGAFFGSMSIVAYALSLLIGLPVIFEYLETGLVPRFPSLIVSGFLLMAGLLLTTTGLILQVIVKKDKQLYELYFNLINGADRP